MRDGYGNESYFDILSSNYSLPKYIREFFNITSPTDYNYPGFIYIKPDGTVENGALTGHFHNCILGDASNKILTNTNAYNVKIIESSYINVLVDSKNSLHYTNYCEIVNSHNSNIKLKRVDKISMYNANGNIDIQLNNIGYYINLIIDASMCNDITLTPSDVPTVYSPTTFFLYKNKDNQILLKKLSDAFETF